METFSVEPEPDYSSMTKAQLQALLDERSIKWTTSMTKAELIELLEGSDV